MKLLLSVITRIHKPAVGTGLQRCASSGPLSASDEALIVGSSRELVQKLGSQVQVRTGFITAEEEQTLLRELDPGLKKKRYEFDHWDDAIHGFRETERLSWGKACEEIIQRVRSIAFAEGSPLLGPVHILDLDKNGFIKPHIDSVKFCGSTIAGINLLSDSVMRLVKQNDTSEWLDLLLPRRSLYILRDQARYDFTHEILKEEQSVFKGRKVPRLRRISVICRNLPDEPPPQADSVVWLPGHGGHPHRCVRTPQHSDLTNFYFIKKN